MGHHAKTPQNRLTQLLRIIAGICLCFGACGFGIVAITTLAEDTLNAGRLIIALATAIVCAIGAVLLLRKRRTVTTQSSAQPEQGASYDIKASTGHAVTIRAKHAGGLPIADGLACTITSFGNNIGIVSGTTQVMLNKSKITDMCIKTETEVQKQYVSSAGGAVGGAILFGAAGALIGGRAKKKTSRTICNYLIITFKKDDDSIAYLAFNLGETTIKAKALIKDFRKSYPDTGAFVEL